MGKRTIRDAILNGPTLKRDSYKGENVAGRWYASLIEPPRRPPMITYFLVEGAIPDPKDHREFVAYGFYKSRRGKWEPFKQFLNHGIASSIGGIPEEQIPRRVLRLARQIKKRRLKPGLSLTLADSLAGYER